MEAGRNFLASTLNAWTPQNTGTAMPRAVLGDPNQNARESTRFLESGSYLRLKLVQLGYSLPKSVLEHLKISRLRVYVSGQNLVTFSKYTGLDPEVGSFDVLNNGVDRMIYPQNKRWLMGLQLTF
ncbi:TonB dependent receptor [compost metagenome]